MIIDLGVPQDVRLLIKRGQTVDFDTPLWEKKSEKKIEINLVKKLGIKPGKIFDYLKKFIGDTVKKDEIIAEKRGLLIDKKVVASEDGEITEVNHETGIITLINLTDKKTIYSFFKGEIVEVEKTKLKIRINDGRHYLIKKSEIDFGAKVCYYHPELSLIADEVERRIVVFEDLDSLNQIKIEALGAVGFVGAKPLLEPTQLPFFQLKNQKDIEAIFRYKKSSCIILKEEDKIIFYE